MRWFKKIVRAILALMPIFTFIFVTPVNALQHNYAAFPAFDQHYLFKNHNNNIVRTNDYSNYGTGYNFWLSANFRLEAKGDSYNSSYSYLNFKYNDSVLYTDFSNNACQYNDIYSIYDIENSSNSLVVSHATTEDYFVDPPENTSGLQQNFNCRRFKEFGSDSVPSFNSDSIPAGLFQCNRNQNGCLGGLTTTSDYIHEELLPYSYSYNGVYLQSSAVDTDSGMHYSNSFSLSDMFNTWFPTFSYLSIPLSSMDNYFVDSNNLYSGRSLEFKGVFDFDGNFQWHENINSNGSYFRLEYSYLKKHINSGQNPLVTGQYVDCNTNLITLSATGTTQLEFSCPLTLSEDMAALSPILSISGNDNYVWLTDHDWRFSAVYLTTDHDDTPGSSFNTNINGGGQIPGDAKNLIGTTSNAIIIDGKDFSASLINLFGFSFINPFAPLLNMFTSQDSCAHIPTLAGMLHSESDEVCPWFPSQVRQITTPVLSIASVMLIFGFAVRWLGSSSGNMFEDASHETDNLSFHNKYKRSKN